MELPAPTSSRAQARALADAQVAAVRDDPAARLELLRRVFGGPVGDARQRLPFGRAALSFMRWQLARGVLAPEHAPAPGSTWWRAVNERLLRDGCETIALLGGAPGTPSTRAVELWLAFADRPTSAHWYRAHNASIVGGYLDAEPLAEAEAPPERFFMNVVLMRVLYAHALAGAPSLALGQLAPLGRLLGDPRLGMAGIFLSLRRVLPDRYPLRAEVDRYVADEQPIGRLLDYDLIGPRLAHLYAWTADALDEPRVLGLVTAGLPTYAWPAEHGHVWRRQRPSVPGRVVARVTRAAVSTTRAG
ncbi:MAG: hypothetical protein J7513_13895 [Solirubrobacteraceae bacterium]|nr:hypothetical protein [Solirubrobacteraceae bacterium]